MNYWLGIDCGGTFLKAGLYDSEGKVYAIERVNLDIITPYPGWTERDPDELWQATLAVIKKVVAKAAIPTQQIKGIGISAQGKGLFLLDKHRQTLGNGILSSDQRSLSIVKKWQEQKIPEQLYPLTRQTLWTGHPVSLLRWIKQNQPERYQHIGAILMSHDYLRFKLTDQVGCELTNISESNLYNIHTQNYDPRLMQQLDIPEIAFVLPPIVKSDEIVGTITKEVAQLTGLNPNTFVVGGFFDVVATAMCSGISDETKLNVVMGTWSVASVIADQIRDSNSYRYVYGAYADRQKYIVHDASPTSSANLEWVLKQLYNINDKTDYRLINQLIDDLPKGESTVLFLPFLYGSNAGLNMMAGFYGLQSFHQKAHLFQAVYEGVIFSLMTHIRRMKNHFPQIKTLCATGGPTQSMVWMQMLADISETTVEIPVLEESGCLGAASVAMIGGNIYQSINELQQKIKPRVSTITPISAHFPVYREKYRYYQEVVSALQSIDLPITTSSAATK